MRSCVAQLRLWTSVWKSSKKIKRCPQAEEDIYFFLCGWDVRGMGLTGTVTSPEHLHVGSTVSLRELILGTWHWPEKLLLKCRRTRSISPPALGKSIPPSIFTASHAAPPQREKLTFFSSFTRGKAKKDCQVVLTSGRWRAWKNALKLLFLSQRSQDLSKQCSLLSWSQNLSTIWVRVMVSHCCQNPHLLPVWKQEYPQRYGHQITAGVGQQLLQVRLNRGYEIIRHFKELRTKNNPLKKVHDNDWVIFKRLIHTK